jgi:hypothetical protein
MKVLEKSQHAHTHTTPHNIKELMEPMAFANRMKSSLQATLTPLWSHCTITAPAWRELQISMVTH